MFSKDEKPRRKAMPPGQTPIKHLLRWGIDHPGIGSVIPDIDPKTWTLTLDGEVENPTKFSWNEFLKLPKSDSVSDFHCVEGWSVLNCRWEGVRFKQIIDIVKPKATAQFAFFECADGYATSLPLSELLGDDILLAYRLDGKELEQGLGRPVRLVVPHKYAYKSAMWITRITFTSKNELGYWEKRGYSDTADVWTNDRFSK